MSFDVTVEDGDVLESSNLTEFSHELYVDSTALEAVLEGRSPSRSLEIGCGFGRLTPWIAAHADRHYAIDLDSDLLAAAAGELRTVRFLRCRSQNLPFPDDTFDLAVTWGVLNHVIETIDAAVAEIDRVVRSDGTLVISEATAGADDPRWTYRSVEEWRDLFASRELVDRRRTDRNAESFRDPEREHVVMTFR